MNKPYKGKISFSFKIMLSALMSFAVSRSHAQLKDCNAFIRGNYVEVGINYNGAYGSAAAPPSGYHARAQSGWSDNKVGCSKDTGKGVGFVADPAKDGWADSTAPARAYYGDYFLPGAAQEGWSIMTDKQVDCWNLYSSSGLPSGMSGDHISYLSSGSKRMTVWQGTYDSLKITQRTILDTANTYFVIRVKIENLTARPRNNVYYLRTVDADNEFHVSGDFITSNKIDLQLPNPSNRTLVSAKGITHPDAYLGMFTKDLRAKAFIIKNIWGTGVAEMLHPSNPIDSIYNEIPSKYLYAEKDSSVDDVGIGIVYKIDLLPAEDSTILLMAYMFRPSDIDAASDDDGELPKEPTKIPDSRDGNLITIAPNPFNNTLHIAGVLENDRVSLFDIHGKAIQLKWENEGYQRHTNTSTLPQGIYILRVEDADGQLKHRQIVQHE